MKEIEISMKMKDTEISSLDDLKKKFSPEILSHFRSGCLSKWLLSQGLLAELDAISAIDKNSSALSQLNVICRIFGLAYSEVTLGDFVDWDEVFKKLGCIPSDSQFESILKLAQQAPINVTTSGAVVGAVLVTLRTAREMKQAELAAAIGLGASTWSRIEKGESGLSLDQLRQVAKVLGVTPGGILDMVEAAEAGVVRQGLLIDPDPAAAIGTVIPVVGAVLVSIIRGSIAALMNDKFPQE